MYAILGKQMSADSHYSELLLFKIKQGTYGFPIQLRGPTEKG
jgi:hypothetical protein